MNILFLCTGNSCRSQMAEGFAKQIDAWQVQSAGLEAHGINPRAIQAMQDVGIDITHQTSTVLTPAMLSWADVIVTLCGHADEHCPIIPAGKDKRHWPLPDPAKAQGDEEAIRMQFRQVRDTIQAHIQSLAQELSASPTRPAPSL